MPYVDLFLWDLKDTDSTRHRSNTGVELSVVVDNLHTIDDAGCAAYCACIY